MIFDMIHVNRMKFRICFILSWTSRGAKAATGAIFSRNLQHKLFTLKFLTFIICTLQSSWCLSKSGLISNFHTNNTMRTYNRALTALNTCLRIPNRNFGGNTTLFILRCTRRPCTINNILKLRSFNTVSFLSNQFCCQFLNKFRCILRNRGQAVMFCRNMIRIFYLKHMFQRGINSIKVLLYNSIPFLGVCLFDGCFNLGNSFIFRQNIRNCKEASLHDGINTCPHAGLTSHFNCINCIELQLFINNLLLNFNR